MRRYQQALMRLSEQARTEMVDLWRSGLARSTFEIAAAAAVARADVRATRLADAGFTVAVLALRAGRPVPSGVVPSVDQRVLRDAIAQVLDTDIETAVTPEQLAASREARLARLARNEPLVTAASTIDGLMVDRGFGWVRRTDPDPCPLCVRWSDGKVRPASVRMARHVGCACVQQPVPM